LTVDNRFRRRALATGGLATVLFLGYTFLFPGSDSLNAGPWLFRHHGAGAAGVGDDCGPPDDWAGTWYWQRSPEEEKQAVAGLFNRYCIRCHGVDGRGVWDIPGVPNFTDARWQACRSDSQLARIILEGRGAVMPPFRGALTLEEAWGLARYLRTFVPGTETSRPDLGTSTEKPMSPLPEKIGTTPAIR
jgi:hypothetical protein